MVDDQNGRDEKAPMKQKPVILTKKTLDKDLDKVTHVEDASKFVAKTLVSPGLGLIFLGLAALWASTYAFGQPGAVVIVIAAAIAAYMAMNIGANDVTNNVGAAVGARAITMTQALVLAAIFEILGATIGGNDVVKTISSDIVDIVAIPKAHVTWIMMASLAAAAIWVNLATWFNAPVSTTHAIVGAVIGAGLAAQGVSAVQWPVVLEITSAWVTSPLLGGLVAAALLYFIKTFILYRDDKISAAKRWIPVLIGLMGGGFTSYMILQLTSSGSLSSLTILALGVVGGIACWGISRPIVRREAAGLENRNSSLRVLFRFPLIGSAALLSFAHGANDVSNAVGPLSAIVRVTEGDHLHQHGPAQFWTLLIGALGISVGLLLFGPRLIRLVGEQITKLNPMRAYCVALSTAITVIVASWLGLPISTTHIAVGSVFGVGFFREWYTRHSKRRLDYIRRRAQEWQIDEPPNPDQYEVGRRRLVRRSHFMTIVGAWTITVPVAAVLSACLYWFMTFVFL